MILTRADRRRFALDDVIIERERQEKLRLEGRFPHTCADDGLSKWEKYGVLASEMGELADALLQDSELQDKNRKPSDIKKELTQVAAVALAWLESLR